MAWVKQGGGTRGIGGLARCDIAPGHYTPFTGAPLPHLPHSVIVLEDNDVLHLTGGGYGVYNTEQQDVEEAVPRVLLTLAMEVEQIMKVGVWEGRFV